MLNYRLSAFITLILLILVAGACSNGIVDPDAPIGELPRDLTPQEMMLVEADRSFSYSVFKKTVAYDNEHENIIISPLSISMALAMTLNGAKGQTYTDMRNALYLQGMETDEINEAFRSLIDLLVTADPKVAMRIANSIWHSDVFDVNQEFAGKMQSYFNAEVNAIDFLDPDAPNTINRWVADKTEGLITELLDEIEPDRIMYLINALYFKGDWLRQFDKDDTRRDNFRLESGETIQVDMMSQQGLFATHFNYDENVQMIELPYGDSLFAMSVLMPADPDTPIDQFIDKKIDADNLARWRSNLSVDMRKSTIDMPKFELEYEIEYSDILKAMGMEIAFTPHAADLSGLSEQGQNNLYLDEVIHKVFIRVDEEGTEAAAATSVGVMPTSMPPQMIVDRPFIFIIHERESGANLFMGVVRDPSK